MEQSDGGIDARWRRRNALGSAVSVVWLLSVIVAVAGGSVIHAGPFGWLASAELALFGTENPVLAAIPMYLLLLGLPYLGARMLPRSLDRPFLCGIQEAIDPARPPVVKPLPGATLRRATRLRNSALVICAVLPLAGAAGFWISSHSGRTAGEPLPQLTPTALAERATALPPFAGIVGAEDHVDRAWVWNRSVRQTRYRDYYFPLTEPGWRPDDPVTLIELDKLLPDDSPGAENVLDPPGPREGALSADAPDSWVVGEMRRQGLHVVDHPILLERRPLGGLTPGPDTILASLFLGLSIALALFAGLFAWNANRRVRMLRGSGAP